MKITRKTHLLIGLLLLLLALQTPATTQAAPADPIAINDITLLDASVVSQQLNNGRLGLGIVATAEGVIDCQNNQACHDAGADGQVISFQQDLQLVVDAARERITGHIVIDVIGAGFTGTVSGSAMALSGEILQLGLTAKANAMGGARVDLTLTAIFNQTTGQLESLIGQGIVSQ